MKHKAHVDAELSQAQLEQLAGRLAHKRRELTDRIEQMEQQIALKDDCSLADAADVASRQESRIRARGIVEQDRQTLGETDAALVRLVSGQYGVSEVTGEPIVYERLLLVPWARTGADEST